MALIMETSVYGVQILYLEDILFTSLVKGDPATQNFDYLCRLKKERETSILFFLSLYVQKKISI